MQLTLSRSRTAPARSEHLLVAAARGGDDRAFEELYAIYRQRIFAFIVSKIHDHGRAEDIAQEVFISALRRLHASDQPISFKPWIYEIAKNACIDEYRRGSRSREVPLGTDENLGAGERPMISLVPTPPGAVENKQRLDDLRGAFDGLSESHHQLVVLREFEGLSYDEIGDRLGMTRQMVESSLFRARRKLTAEYGELASGRRCEQIQTAIESGAAQSITSLGVRERRRLSRHFGHCQTCRQTARLAGVDEALLKPRSIAAKIAALLPFPLLRRPWGAGRGQGGTPGRSDGATGKGGAPAHSQGATGKGGAPAHSGSHHGMTTASAARIAEPASSSLSLGQAAAAAAALAIAGAGTGLVVGAGHHQHSPSPSSAVQAAKTLQRSQQRPAGSVASSVSPPAAGSRAKRARVAGAASGRAVTARFPGAGSGRAGANTLRPRIGGPGRNSTGSGSGSGAHGSSSSTASPVSNAVGSIRSTVSGVTGTVGSTVSGVKKTLGSTVSGVKKTVGSTVSGATHTAGSTVSGVKKTLGSTVSGVVHAVGPHVPPATPGSTAGRVGSTLGNAGSTAGKAVKSISGSGSSSSSLTSGAGAAAHSVTAPVNSVASGLLPPK